MLFTILLFFAYTHGLGYSLTRFLKKPSLETFIMRIGIGMGALPVLGLLLNTLRIPLDWRIFLILTNLFVLYDLGQSILKRDFPFEYKPIQPIVIILLFIFLAHMFVFCFGAFSYPWLEDSDPYEHAAGIKYISAEKSITVSPGQFHYINPYPPGYDLVFAILHQTSPSLYTTLKFFNCLIVSLGLLFFFYLVKELSNHAQKALSATFLLAIIPCYLTHFIWAHSLAVTLFLPALYLIWKSEDDKRFIWPAAIVTAGIILTSPTQGLKFFILISLTILWLSYLKRQWLKNFIKTLALAILFSSMWWIPLVKDIVKGVSVFSYLRASPISTIAIGRAVLTPFGGTATRAYHFMDYVTFPRINLINSPTGIGPIFFILGMIGLCICAHKIFKSPAPQKSYPALLLIWLIFSFIGMNSETFHLPVGLFAFRFWLLFAVPVVLLATEAIFFITGKCPKKFFQYGFLGLIFLILLPTTVFHKFIINTGIWSQGDFWESSDELKGYLWLKENLKPNTKVFALHENMLVIGHDMHADYWSAPYKKALTDAIHLDPDQLFTRLKDNQFEYIILSEKDLRVFGKEKILAFLKTLNKNRHFALTYTNPDIFWVYKIL